VNTENNGSRRPAADGLAQIRHAADAYQSAKLQRSIDVLTVADDELRTAVRTAVYDDAVSWQSIGDALGIRRGAAYQRFRRKPQSAIHAGPQL
jgi:hypothetical protein